MSRQVLMVVAGTLVCNVLGWQVLGGIANAAGGGGAGGGAAGGGGGGTGAAATGGNGGAGAGGGVGNAAVPSVGASGNAGQSSAGAASNAAQPSAGAAANAALPSGGASANASLPAGGSPAAGSAGSGRGGQTPGAMFNGQARFNGQTGFNGNRRAGGNPGLTDPNAPTGQAAHKPQSYNTNAALNGQYRTPAPMFNANANANQNYPNGINYASGTPSAQGGSMGTAYIPNATNAAASGQVNGQAAGTGVATPVNPQGGNNAPAGQAAAPGGLVASNNAANVRGGVQWYNGNWWYMTPQNTWMWYNNGVWQNYNASANSARGQNGQ